MQAENLVSAFRRFANMTRRSKNSVTDYETGRDVESLLRQVKRDLEFNFDKLSEKMQAIEATMSSRRPSLKTKNMITEVSMEAETTSDSHACGSSSSSSSSNFDINNQLREIKLGAEQLKKFLKLKIEEFDSNMAFWLQKCFASRTFMANDNDEAVAAPIDCSFMIKGAAGNFRELLERTLCNFQFYVDCLAGAKSNFLNKIKSKLASVHGINTFEHEK
jgi:hypothetical protein